MKGWFLEVFVLHVGGSSVAGLFDAAVECVGGFGSGVVVGFVGLLGWLIWWVRAGWGYLML